MADHDQTAGDGSDRRRSSGAASSHRIEDWIGRSEHAYAPTARTALESLADGGGSIPAVGDLAVRVEAAPLAGLVLLRAALSEPPVQRALSEALSRTLSSSAVPSGGASDFPLRTPPEPDLAALSGGRGLLRLESDTLLILTDLAEADAVAAALDKALARQTRLVATVSDGWSGFRLSGQGAREVLAKGLDLDLHPAVFGPDALRRAALGPCEIVVFHAEGAGERFELLCRRSYAAAVYDWLLSAAAAGSLPEALPPAAD